MTTTPTQEAVQNMRDVLTTAGWVMYHECGNPCYKEYYQHPAHIGYGVVIKKNQSLAWITLNDQTIEGAFWGYNLEKELKDLFE